MVSRFQRTGSRGTRVLQKTHTTGLSFQGQLLARKSLSSGKERKRSHIVAFGSCGRSRSVLLHASVCHPSCMPRGPLRRLRPSNATATCRQAAEVISDYLPFLNVYICLCYTDIKADCAYLQESQLLASLRAESALVYYLARSFITARWDLSFECGGQAGRACA